MKILVLCIDRDDDFGKKTRIRGPVVGRKEVLSAGARLLLSDPQETDANAAFAAVKIYDELKGEKEVAILTGSQKVGYESDMRIKAQAEELQKKFKATGAIVVSDGKEDEMVVPAIEHIVPILSMHRISVSSGEELKGIYYTLSNFFKRTKEDPFLAMMLFGLPGVAAVLFALLGPQSWRIIAGFLGAFFLVKGLRLDGFFSKAWEVLGNSFKTLSASFFFYLASVVTIIIAGVMTTYVPFATPLRTFAAISTGTLHIFFYGILSALIGLSIDSLPDRKKAYGFVSTGVGLGVVVLIFRSLGNWILEATYPLSYVVTTAVLGLAVATLTKLASKLIKE